MASNGSAGIRDFPLDPGIFLDEDLGSDWYIYESTESAAPSDDLFPAVIPECHPTVSPRMYHTCMAPISLAVILALSFLVKRRRLHRSCCNGVPGLLSPANFLEEESSRGPAVAVFGILFSSLCQLVLDKEPLPLASPSSHGAREYWKILALLYYPAFYFPLLACATSRHRLGYLAGSLLAWGHCLVHVWQKVECPQSPKIHRLYSLLSHVPTLLSLLLLSLWYPALLGRSLRGNGPEREIPGSGYYRKYLKAVLSKRGRKGSSAPIEKSLQSRIRSYLRSYIYAPEEGFRIPLKLVVSLAMAVIAVYQVALLLLVAFVPTIQIIRAGMTKDIVVLLVQFGLVPSDNPAVPGDMEKELRTVRHYLWSLEVCYICSLALGCLLTCAGLLRTLAAHRWGRGPNIPIPIIPIPIPSIPIPIPDIPIPNIPLPIPNIPFPVPNGPVPIPNSPVPIPNVPVPIPNIPIPIPDIPIPIPNIPLPIPNIPLPIPNIPIPIPNIPIPNIPLPIPNIP
ncbi:receptor for retinol uptake STRA6-like, partial [Corvus kubaryi]|uniref:receptor for retinol uptake STRA6-like n=1 Tax=Corvus kubaryi TaxID=68294 RepID=UPI001C05BF55